MNCKTAVAALTIALLASTGCGKDDAQAKPEEPMLPATGDHTVTLTVTRVDPSGDMPYHVGDTQEDRFCVTKDVAAFGFKPVLERGIRDVMGNSPVCAYSSFRLTGDKVDAVYNCQSKEGDAKAQILLSGTVEPQAWDVAMRIETRFSDAPQERPVFDVRMQSRWQGKCMEDWINNALRH